MLFRSRQICKFSWFFDPHNVNEEQKARIRNIEKGVLFSDCMLDSALFRLDTYDQAVSSLAGDNQRSG